MTAVLPVAVASDPVVRRPSPSRGQYVLLMVVLLLTGTFAGTLIFNDVWGTTWARAISDCSDEAVQRFPDPVNGESGLDRSLWAIRCSAPAEHQKALTAIGGGVAVLLLGLVLTWALPRRMVRRLGGLRAPPAKWPHALDQATSTMDLRRPARVVLGPSGCVEPFTVHRDGLAHIVLPAGARMLPAGELEAVLRHEAAHVLAGDVRLVWLTRGLRWALPVVAAAPLAWLAVRSTTDGRTFAQSFGHWFWLEYALRTVALLVVALVLAAKIGRAREHEADVHAAACGSHQDLIAVIGRGAPPAMSFWARLARSHPAPQRRIAIVHRPSALAGLDLVDDVAAGILAATVLLAAFSLVSDGLVGTPLSSESPAVAAVIAGALLASTWGLSVWRRAVTHPTASRWQATYGPVLAMVVGVPVGMLIGVADAGTTGSGPYGYWPSIVTVPLTIASAGAFSTRLAAAWAAGRAASARRWIAPFVVNTVLFGLACWIGPMVALMGQFLPPNTYLLFSRGAPWADGIVLALVAGCLLAWRWRAHPAERRVAVSVAVLATSTATAAAAALAVRRFMVTTVDADAPVVALRLDAWTAAAAGIGLALALLVLRGAAALTDTLRAAPVAAVAVALAAWGRWLPQWNSPAAAAQEYVLTALASLAVTLLVLGLLMTFPPQGYGLRHVPAWLTPLVAAAASAALTATLLRHADLLAYS